MMDAFRSPAPGRHFGASTPFARFLIAGALAASHAISAQDLPSSLLRSPDSPPPVYTSRPLLRLPLVELDEKARANIREIRLMVKPPDGLWTMHSSGPADQKTFDFKAGADGEYRFTFVMVSRSGNMYPADPDKVPPHRVVVLDTVAPTLSVQTLQLPGGAIVAHARIDDANPKPESIRMTCKMPGGNWQAMELVSSDAPGAYRVPNPTLFDGGTLRVTATDAAGNAVASEVRIDIPPESLTPKVAATIALRTSDKPTIVPVRSTTAARIEPPLPIALDELLPANPDEIPTPEPIRVSKALVRERFEAGPPGMRPPVITEGPGSMATRTVPSGYQLPSARADSPIRLPENVVGETPAPVLPAAAARVETPTSVPVFATPRMLLDYRPDANARPLLFWLTRDRGQTWERLRDDNPGQSPAKLVLPGEGVFGISARVGAEAKAPIAGDAIDTWAEIDSTKPQVRIDKIEPTASDSSGITTISWTATDRNLTATPISLSYATKAEGPWSPIALGLRNEGMHRWNRPANGEEMWIRIEAADRAGNVGEFEAKLEATSPAEATRPKVRVLGVGPGE